MKRRLILSLLLCCVSVGAAAQSRVAAALDSLPKTKKIDQVAISPDGTQVAYIVEGELMVTPLAGGAAHTLTTDPKLPAREVTWSADSKSVAWLADLPGDVLASELWTAPADGGRATRLAEFKGFTETPRFSPDGSLIAVLYIEGMPRIAGPLQPETPLAGVVGEKIYEQRITTIDLKTKKLTQVTRADVYVYEYDWAPDAKNWAAIAAHGSGDNNWWIARLYRIDAANGQLHEIYKPKWQIAEPHVSPDGKNVAFIEGLMSDEGLTGGEIYVVPLTGGTAQDLTPKIKASPSSLAWNAPDGLIFVANKEGEPALGWGNSPRPHTSGAPLSPYNPRIQLAFPREHGFPQRRSRVTGKRWRSSRRIRAHRRKHSRAPNSSGSKSPTLTTMLRPPGAKVKSAHWMSGTIERPGHG